MTDVTCQTAYSITHSRSENFCDLENNAQMRPQCTLEIGFRNMLLLLLKLWVHRNLHWGRNHSKQPLCDNPNRQGRDILCWQTVVRKWHFFWQSRPWGTSHQFLTVACSVMSQDLKRLWERSKHFLCEICSAVSENAGVGAPGRLMGSTRQWGFCTDELSVIDLDLRRVASNSKFFLPSTLKQMVALLEKMSRDNLNWFCLVCSRSVCCVFLPRARLGECVGGGGYSFLVFQLWWFTHQILKWNSRGKPAGWPGLPSEPENCQNHSILTACFVFQWKQDHTVQDSWINAALFEGGIPLWDVLFLCGVWEAFFCQRVKVKESLWPMKALNVPTALWANKCSCKHHSFGALCLLSALHWFRNRPTSDFVLEWL